MTSASDRVGGVLTTNASSASQGSARTKYGFFPTDNATDKFFSQANQKNSAELNKMKMIEVGAADWTASTADLHELLTIKLPQAFYKDKTTPAHGPTRPWASVRTGFDFELQANAVTGCCGALLMVYVPPHVDINKLEPSSYRMFDSAELNVGTDTTAKMHVSYTNIYNYVPTDSDDLGTVRVYIWSQLTVPASTPGTVSIVVYGSLSDMDLQCPRPQGPTRNRLEVAEGPGTLNIANARLTRYSNSVALNGESAAVDPNTSGSTKAIRDLKEMFRVYHVMAGAHTTAWNVSAGRETNVYTTGVYINNSTRFTRFLANAYTYWRGSIVFRVTVYSSTLHKGRLRCCFFGTPQGTQSSGFTYAQSANALYKILDIGLNPSVKIVVPFMSDTWLRDCSDSVGRLSIFVSSRLSASTNCAPNVRFMVEMRPGDDFELCVPVDRGLVFQNEDDGDLTNWGEKNKSGDVITTQDQHVTGSMVDCSTEGAAVAAGLSAQGQELDKPGPADDNTKQTPKFLNAIIKRVNVVKASHTNIQVLFGRGAYIGIYSMNAGTDHQFLVPFPRSGHYALSRLFAYWNGDVNFHILNESGAPVTVAHCYTNHADPNQSTIATMGAVTIPAWHAYSLSCPFYYGQPARATEEDASLGYIYAHAAGTGDIKVWVSFKTVSFFQPLPTPKQASARSYVQFHKNTNLKTSCHSGVLQLMKARDFDKPLGPNTLVPKKKLPANDMLLAWMDMEGGSEKEDDYVHDLTQDGDVESNPGPTCQLVYLYRGLYKHYGVRHGNKVIHMNSEDILSTAMNGAVNIIITDWHPEWIEETALDITQLRLEALEESVGKESFFSGSNNCETFAKEALGIGSVTQARALACFGLILCSATSTTILGQSPKKKAGKITQAFKDAATSAWNNVSSFFSDQLLEGIKSTVVKTVAKMLVRVVCYGICFCSSPSILTGAAVATLIGLDVVGCDGIGTCVKDLCTALLDGDLAGCMEAMSELMHKNDPDRRILVSETVAEVRRMARELVGEGLILPDAPGDNFRAFNAASQAGRNIEWWITLISRFFNWIKSKFSTSNGTLALNWMEENQGTITTIMHEADNIISESRSPKSLKHADYQASVVEITRKMTTLKYICMTAQSLGVLGQINQLLTKLQKIPNPQTTNGEIFRFEPVGIWVSGPAGCGKSTFSMEVLSRVRQQLIDDGVKIDDNGIFTTPSGSDHMDGYQNQWIHLVDDMAQNREEEDVKFVCQMLSSVPFTPPMASLEEKGTRYTSQIFLATTNRTNFESVALWDSAAYERRFKFKLTLKVNKVFETPEGRLDVAKATASNALGTGQAWMISRDLKNPDYRIGSIDQIAKSIVCEYKTKLRNQQMLNARYQGLAGNAIKRESFVDWETVINELKTRDPKPLEIKPDGDDDDINTPLINAADKVLKKLEEGADGEKTCKEELLKCFAELEGVSDDSPFESLKSFKTSAMKMREAPGKIKDWLKKRLDETKEWWEENKWWLLAFAAVGTVVTTVVTIYGYYRKAQRWVFEEGVKEYLMNKNQQEVAEAQRPYNPMTERSKGKETRKVNLKILPDGPNPAEYSHLYKCGVNLTAAGKNIYAMATGPHTLLTYKHYIMKCGGIIDSLTWSGLDVKLKPEDYTITTVTLDNEMDTIETDFIYIDFPRLPFQMKSARKYLASPKYGQSGVALMTHKAGNYSQGVENIQMATDYVVAFREGDMRQSDGLIYATCSFAGMCGAMIVQKIEGSWKIVGMHHAGNRDTFGYAFRIRLLPEPDGIVTSKEKAPTTHYTPTKTALRPSPMIGIVDTNMGPAPLSSRDDRLEITVDNLVKHAAEKYRVNTYNPDERVMNEVTYQTTSALFSATGRCSMWTIEEALDGGGMNPIDMSTSPGKKYVDKGLKKKDLFWKNSSGDWEVAPFFRHDVEMMMDDIRAGRADTIFAATLKDELRPKSKIADGKTRCIEACPVDYTIAFRMIFGSMFNKIYTTDAMRTGLAVGIDPYVDYHALSGSMLKHWFAIDFARFDGSLSDGLMRAAAEVMCTPLDDPELGMRALEPVINSRHWVHDEIWNIQGGMPSGSPCTTVLNSICNLLVCKYAILATEGVPPESIRIVTYGDDVLGSVESELDGEGITKLIFSVFGMEATSADKKSANIMVEPNHATFLKRSFRYFPGTRFVTGVLDLESMLQKIQWCHGIKEFKQQFESFTLELTLHGQETYNQVMEAARTRLDKYGVYVPPYKVAYNRAFAQFFE